MVTGGASGRLATSRASWPPAEKPSSAVRLGSTPSSAALATSQRRPSITSEGACRQVAGGVSR
ncbi:hypothetical protein JOF53_008403 [Crossiella equi]|uniref:Uncharacterized protein n=1 Tax=Crossiella equi TaxID=130796 RepID=A0ABS5ASJ0_9PSEU|nr:hypothetical protein [Crossiella equi]MBP2479531.1 hypothetical protein [Crossiella equi]